jgi:hypothetical protein
MMIIIENLRKRKMKKGVIVILIALLSVSIIGCTTVPRRISLPEKEREHIESVAVVSAQYGPECVLNVYAKGAGSGAAKGVAQGAEAGLEAIVDGGELLFLAPVLLPVFLIGGATIGGMAGASAAIPAEQAKGIECMIHSAVDECTIPRSLSAHAVETGSASTACRFRNFENIGPISPDQSPDYSSIAHKEADTVLEIRTPSAGVTSFGKGKDKPHFFYVEAETRLIRTADGAELTSRSFIYFSEPLHIEELCNDGTVIIRECIDDSYQVLSENIIDTLFLTTSYSGNYLRKDGGLQPLYPKQQKAPFSDKLAFVKVDSLQPELSWEAFPRPADKKLDTAKESISSIKNVTYDLRIWMVKDEYPGEKVYERKGLPLPSHRLETPLSPDTAYFWTVRARYTLTGQTRVTRWSFYNKPAVYGACTFIPLIPEPLYFRFKTPA